MGTDEIFNIDNSDTICAVATGQGRGAIAMVRVSGQDAVSIVNSLWKGKDLATVKSHTVHYGQLLDGDETLDDAVATVFRGPNSFTGEDVVEISVHGSIYIVRRLLQLLIDAGCRPAIAGEFTRRAFLAGKMDLAQAEAVADVIASTSKGAHRLASRQLKGSVSHKIEQMRRQLVELASLLELELDFSEEDVEFASRSRLIELCDETIRTLSNLAESYATGQAIVNGLTVVIAGVPNAGKSTLLNLLLNDDRAIVSDIPGTTRDTIEDSVEIDGALLRLIDTAGLRADTPDIIELEGIGRTLARAKNAAIIVFLIDASRLTEAADIASQRQALEILTRECSTPGPLVLPVLNKIDAVSIPHSQLSETVKSILDEAGDVCKVAGTLEHTVLQPETFRELRGRLSAEAHRVLDNSSSSDTILINERHHRVLLEALKELRAMSQSLKRNDTVDITAQHLRASINAIATITGRISTPEVLQTIFSRFCIGK